ncbi:hypothetical protein PDESU_04431 [Pontiella desulfatans]|uniref:Uncharacterized protein n=1 Tax=Pontiella desulfatans TaxID=2750659 RepID=A0A6C2U8X5_PONDE|nr:hypothetical protein [Pontiella desulfatans]VGO15844.1 hypothetical protein PDESU_04431 [Pontiella desulfatans]
MKALVMTTMAAAVVLIAGCEYEEPLVKEHTIAIDQALIGLWEPVPRKGVHEDEDDRMMVLRYSGTEYLIHHPMGQNSIYYRGYPIKLGGVACVQLEAIGTGEGDVEEADKNHLFHVARYAITNGVLDVRLLNEDVVSNNLKTTEELRKVFIENSGNIELFDDDPGLFRKR